MRATPPRPVTTGCGRGCARTRSRSVAHAFAFGPAHGLAITDALLREPSLRSYHLLPSARGDFLWKLGRLAEARAEFERAASLTQNARERTLLLERAAACGRGEESAKSSLPRFPHRGRRRRSRRACPRRPCRSTPSAC